jgi:hypothetical protein
MEELLFYSMVNLIFFDQEKKQKILFSLGNDDSQIPTLKVWKQDLELLRFNPLI